MADGWCLGLLSEALAVRAEGSSLPVCPLSGGHRVAVIYPSPREVTAEKREVSLTACTKDLLNAKIPNRQLVKTQ